MKNNFICGLAYLITRHKKEYIFLNRNFSEIILRVYISDEESVSSDSSNDHCNSLDSAYLTFIEFSLNRTGCRGELQRTVLRISLRAVLSRPVNLSISENFVVEIRFIPISWILKVIDEPFIVILHLMQTLKYRLPSGIVTIQTSNWIWIKLIGGQKIMPKRRKQKSKWKKTVNFSCKIKVVKNLLN